MMQCVLSADFLLGEMRSLNSLKNSELLILLPQASLYSADLKGLLWGTGVGVNLPDLL